MDRISFIRLVSLWYVFAIFFAGPIDVNAQLAHPNFPSCLNPSGQLIVSYATGIHGVPGKPDSYPGSDKVYLLENGNNLQCLCTISGGGIKTSWWKTGSITQEEIDVLKADNWVLVPDGSIWGLDKETYMAKNEYYSCDGSNSGSGGSSSSTSSSGGSSGQVQGTSTRFGQVLGLATTGTLPVIASYLGFGIVLLLASRLLKK